MAENLTDDQLNQIREHLQEGRKLVAIKMHRKWTGSSLLDAKKSVEQIAAGIDVSTSPGDELQGEQMDAILDAIQKGQKLQAVKLYQQSSGTSLKESKEFIERLMSELEIADPGSVAGGGGCGSAALMIVVLAAGIVVSLTP